MSLDPYKALGLDNKAGPEQVKQAYRRLAKQYHPDRNPGDKAAEEKFKELSMAYDILSDPAKKTEYDNLGREAFFERGFNGAGYRPNFDAEGFPWGDSFFKDLFGGQSEGRARKAGGFSFEHVFGGGGARSFGGGARSFGGRPKPTKGGDREHELTLDFRDAALGTEITLGLDVSADCSRCGGQGVLSNGGGVKTCPACRGRGSQSSRQTLKARIPAGVKDGQKIRLRGKGLPGERGGPPGDLNLTVKVNPDPVFTRGDDLNLRLEKEVDLYQAMLGGALEVPTLGGKATLKLPPGSQNGAKFRLKGQGVSVGRKTGDLIVTVKVVLPGPLSPEANKLVERLRELAPVEIDGHERN
ncbi:MAG: DnaJ domain-containing protein [Deltaproteobacteria bacterium]|jgi:molecular chaperone DnaJ|nr:DnaJ domain-containing protein [Deltaproteobacteria bacterium]